MIRYSLLAMCMAVAFGVSAAAETKGPGILFSESFDDQNVVKRGWYDNVKIRISDEDAYAGAGCIEHEWEDGGTAIGSQGSLRGGYNGKLYDSREALLDDANWHCIEAMFKLNSVDIENDNSNN